jgi:hypothetical protein
MVPGLHVHQREVLRTFFSAEGVFHSREGIHIVDSHVVQFPVIVEIVQLKILKFITLY